ncbi:hypothetical protein ACFRMN_34070 [Streptomyces sp. NPDC056835]|uniref:hypothetical protein n=1 Tax=Streptomyces sp. NPDC056835 TaxID=3345956 RepID=UPI0036C2F09D
MTPTLPRTVRAVDTAQLLGLAQEAAMHGFSQRLPVDPDTFDKLPETLDTTSKRDVVGRIERAMTQREWVERMAADTDPDEMPRNCKA